MRRARLQKRARLLKAAEFNRVFNKARRSADQYFTVLARPNDKDLPRLGLAISKKKSTTRCNAQPDQESHSGRFSAQTARTMLC